jgi:hypothetical protein
VQEFLSQAACAVLWKTVLSPSTWPNQILYFLRSGRMRSAFLKPVTKPKFAGLANCLRDARHPHGPRQHPLWRLRPERWPESLVAGNVSVVDGRLESSCQYSQVPVFSACDRAMIDVFAVTHAGGLAVVELKANGDIHLPLHGLDYWSRVEWHHARGEFPRVGYFKKAVNCQPTSRSYFW